LENLVIIIVQFDSSLINFYCGAATHRGPEPPHFWVFRSLTRTSHSR